MAPTVDDEDLLSISTVSSRRRMTASAERSGRSGNGRNQHAPERSRTETMQRTSNRLGQYNIVRTLGEGSFGKVKLAVHQGTGQKVALKIINRKKLVTRDMAGRIEREIQYLQLLRHPHIIKLYTVITTAAEIIMVLEYAGGELFDYLVQNGKMTEDKARRFFQQIVCAVEYCHRHKIVHRDLKPENLLLDETLNVKIADFGLSNIMTDGNFLKTSCGSPNYAAPEVISGKLYAGPEVDVWSCGVILYVLLVGRLPFDDEYIPTLFKKIAQGQFHMPGYLSPGAVRLIRRMLVVSPVQRITVAEIRQDPWFSQDIPPYLQVQTDEFFNTGVEPNKSLDLEAMRSKPATVELHEAVVDKLRKTIGYTTEDLQEALTKDEPSAIKDAYNIVRENQMMKENPLLAQESSLQPFLAQSPPAMSSPLASSPFPPSMTSTPSRSIPKERSRQSASGTQSKPEVREAARSPATTIAVLPSSLPDIHRAYMDGYPTSNAMPTSNEQVTPQSSGKQSAEQQAITARLLNPHSRSQLALDKAASKPEKMTPMPAKKPRPTKWQFGIRSRNAPAEAMLALYKALQSMGADWEVSRIRKPGADGSRSGSSRSRSSSRSSSGSRGRRHRTNDDDDEDGDHEQRWSDEEDDVDQHHDDRHHRSSAATMSYRGRLRERRSRYGPHNDWGYDVPIDPWVINARFRKRDLYPPGAGSAHSSRVDLTDVEEEVARRRSGLKDNDGTTGTAADNASYSGPGAAAATKSHNEGPGTPKAGKHVSDDPQSLYVYVTIQLYTIEKEFFLVDFKCAGYEQLAKEIVREVKVQLPGGGFEWRRLGENEEAEEGSTRKREEIVGLGRTNNEKNATSPFPFLDVASALIINLAEGGGQPPPSQHH